MRIAASMSPATATPTPMPALAPTDNPPPRLDGTALVVVGGGVVAVVAVVVVDEDTTGCVGVTVIIKVAVSYWDVEVTSSSSRSQPSMTH
jgi:hypothetical protein